MPYVTYKNDEINSVSICKPTDFFDLIVTDKTPTSEQLNVSVITAFLYNDSGAWNFIYVHPDRSNATGVISNTVTIKLLDAATKEYTDNRCNLNCFELAGIRSVLPQDVSFAQNLLQEGVTFVEDDNADLAAFKTKIADIKTKLQTLKTKKESIQDLMPEVVANPTTENKAQLSALISERDTLMNELETI